MIDDIKQIKQIMSEAAFKVIGWNIAVDTKLIGSQYKQSKEHQERWNKLYEKLLNAKNQIVRYSVFTVRQSVFGVRYSVATVR